jgi:hypothetical protein
MRKKLLTSLLIASFLVLLFVSMSAVLVKADNLTAPVVSASAASINVGQTSTLSVITDISGGTGPFSYQWIEAYDSSSFLNISSSTSSAASYIFDSSGMPIGAYTFELNVTDSTGAYVISNAVTVTVNPDLVAPVVSASPVSINVGQASTLSVSTDITGGTSPYSYQWMEEIPGSSSYSVIGSATPSAASYDFVTSGSTTTGTWSFELMVTDNTTVSVTSNAVTVTVNADLVAPVVSASPASINMDQTSALSVLNDISGGTSPFLYQWMMEVPGGSSYSVIGSATSSASSYNFDSTNMATGTYFFELNVTDTTGASVMSNAVTVTVDADLVAPVVSASATSINVGQISTLSVVTDISGGTSPFLYQWMMEVPGGSSYSAIGSATPSAASYVFDSASVFTGTYTFELVVSDSTGVYVTSNTVTVTVNGAPTVTVSPASWTMDVGQSTTFSAIASSGSGTYTSYQWYVNGQLAQSGSASMMPFTPSSSGSYSITVNVTDSFGVTSALSSAVSVIVSASPTVSIAPVGPLTLDAGQVQTFTATPSGGTGTLSYQWYLNGSAVSGATSASYSYTASGTSHSVTCTVTDSASTPVTSPTSNAVSVTVTSTSTSPTPTVTPTPTPTPTLTPTSPLTATPTPAVTLAPTPSQTIALASMGQYLPVIAGVIVLGAVIVGVFIRRRRKRPGVAVLS